MKTAIRSSTFWWPLVFLFVVIAPTRALAAGAPSGGSRRGRSLTSPRTNGAGELPLFGVPHLSGSEAIENGFG